jgi:multiple sugar transport system permease protein
VTPSRSPGVKEGRLLRRDMRPLLVLMIPAVAIIVIVDLAPVLIGVINSFRLLAFSTLGHWVTAPWLGFQNYSEALSGGGGLTDSGLHATWQSIQFSVITTVIALPIGVLAAGTVAVRTSPLTRVIRAVYLIPFSLPLFSTAFLWRMIFQPGTGLLDWLRRGLGLGDGPNRLLVGQHSFAALVASDVWFAWGFIYLFALAGLQSIDPDVYEAAVLDGAGRWQRFRYITYPGIAKLLAVAVVLSTISHYNDFTLPYVMFGSTPPSSVDVLPVLTYQAGFSLYNFGLSDAVAVIGLITLLIPILAYIWIIVGKERR